jgi:membrane protease YdiL (CAAX protease family)
MDINTPQAPRPLWRKVWDFPLVALVVSFALIFAAAYAIGRAFAGLPTVVGRDGAVAIVALVTAGVVFGLYKIVIARLGRVRRDDLPLHGHWRELSAGLGGGALLFALTAIVAAIAGAYHISGWQPRPDWVGNLLGAGLVAAVVEEILFRGVLFRFTEEMLGSWAALVITSALFGLGHLGNEGATAFSAIAVAVEAGTLLGAAYMLTGSLWLPIGIHFGWNVTQGLVFAVPVSGGVTRGIVTAELSGPTWLSGGAFGLEASVIAVVVAGGAGVWLLVRAARAGRVVPPMWARRKTA